MVCDMATFIGGPLDGLTIERSASILTSPNWGSALYLFDETQNAYVWRGDDVIHIRPSNDETTTR